MWVGLTFNETSAQNLQCQVLFLYFFIQTDTWSTGGGPCVDSFFSFQKDFIPKQHSYIIPKTTVFISCASISLRESGEWSVRERAFTTCFWSSDK